MSMIQCKKMFEQITKNTENINTVNINKEKNTEMCYIGLNVVIVTTCLLAIILVIKTILPRRCYLVW